MVLLTSAALLASGGAAGYVASRRADVPHDPADGDEAGRAGDGGAEARRRRNEAELQALERLQAAEVAICSAGSQRRAEELEAELERERAKIAGSAERERRLRCQVDALQADLRQERQRLGDCAAWEEELHRQLDAVKARTSLLETERDLLDARCAAVTEELEGLLRGSEAAPSVQPPPRERPPSGPPSVEQASLQRRLQRASRPVATGTPPCPPPLAANALRAAGTPQGRGAARGSCEEEPPAHACTPSTAASISSGYSPSEAADACEVAPARWVARAPPSPSSPCSGPVSPRRTRPMAERLRLGLSS